MTITDEKASPSLLKRLGSLLPGKQGKKANKQMEFEDSTSYWEERYASGGNSGVGSYAKFAEFKAEILNDFVKQNDIHSVIELGCGDGNQLQLASYPDYTGFDVSVTVLEQCQQKFAGDATKRFLQMNEYTTQQADLSLSLDVIFHLVEDEIFHNYMTTLFASASRYVIVFSSNTDDNTDQQGVHVRHRCFSDWIEAHASGWKLHQHIPNRHPYKGSYRTGSFADFYIYKKG